MNTAQKAAIAGMSRALKAANPAFTRAAVGAVAKLAKRGETFTTDDVWALIPRDVYTPERRALGPVMKALHDAKVIRQTGNFRRSTRRESHANPKAVWIGVI